LGLNLYPRNSSSQLDPELFRNPTCEYRGTPFWSWNTRLDIPELLWQIEALKAMGMGGFHMHSRVGLQTEYLGPDFMAAVKACVAKAKSEQMLAWLYDEDRWPSGFAGGLVTRELQFRRKHLRLMPKAQETLPAGASLVGRYWIRLERGCLAEYRRLTDGQQSPKGGQVWYAYCECESPSTWFNNQAYVDTLSRPAIEKFIEATHERYRQAVGQEFGKVVPAIFTDEPLFTVARPLPRPDSQTDAELSWTTDFPDTYRAQYQQDILDYLPELFWQLPAGKPSLARWRYHEHNVARFSAAFAQTIGQWCERHGIALTGHMMAEQTLSSQAAWIGDAMRSLHHFQLPGVDMLIDGIELTTAKQAQSVARQDGRHGALSELYGVTNWDFDFAGHKRQGDWQAALGITVRVHHLAWVSMEGEAKRDYPAAIGWQSPWWKQYPLVENHFARLNTVLTRGRSLVRVAVVHPIESYWLHMGDRKSTTAARNERDRAFDDVTRWTLHGLVDFDYLCEAILPDQKPTAADKKLRVGQSQYEAVVVPDLQTIRATTLQVLEQLVDAGGTVIFAGQVPALVDAQPSDRARKLAQRSRQIGFSRVALLEALEPWRDVAVFGPAGLADNLLYQMRQDGQHRHVFICNTDRAAGYANATVSLDGRWTIEQLDTISGQIRPLSVRHEADKTHFEADLPGCGHLLVRATPHSGADLAAAPRVARQYTELDRLNSPVAVSLSEPNVLMLDQAEFRLDGGKWESREEILRIDNLLRQRLGWPNVGGNMAQPWTEPPSPLDHRVALRFQIQSDIVLSGARLAVERSGDARITLDGQPVTAQADGWWTDKSIHTVPLPQISPGRHELVVDLAYGQRTSLEWCYLLGDFGVKSSGRCARIVEPVRQLTFGDWTRQGLPFYGGNVTYHCEVELPQGQDLTLQVPFFRAPLLTVEVDGQPCDAIAFPPYEVQLPALPAGKHRLDITAFGSRINCFGAIHNCDPTVRWYGPNAYRSVDQAWSYEYQLRPCGILVAPRLLATAR